MIGGVALALDQIAGLEIDEPIRTGPTGFRFAGASRELAPL
jgi:hypothetical protein